MCDSNGKAINWYDVCLREAGKEGMLGTDAVSLTGTSLSKSTSGVDGYSCPYGYSSFQVPSGSISKQSGQGSRNSAKPSLGSR